MLRSEWRGFEDRSGEEELEKAGSVDDWPEDFSRFFWKAKNFFFPAFSLEARSSSSFILFGVDFERGDAKSGATSTEKCFKSQF